MVTRKLIAALIAAGLSTPLWAADTQQAQDKEQTKEQAKTQAREQIYGSQLMTAEERRAYHSKMHAAKTLEEREQIRHEHHEEMVKRAQEKGITLPEVPPMPGGGMGPGGGMVPGGGMAPGGGMGPGMGTGGGMGPGGGGMGPGRYR